MPKQPPAPQRVDVRHSRPRRPDAASLARVQLVLATTNPGWFGDARLQRQRYGCECEHCAARRAEPITCPHCGYEGPPVVTACECRKVRRSNIAFCRRKLRELAGRRTPAPGDYSHEQLEAMLAESESRPDARCTPGTMRSCGHGLVACPTCGADPSWADYDIDPDHLLSVIRAVRDALRGGE